MKFKAKTLIYWVIFIVVLLFFADNIFFVKNIWLSVMLGLAAAFFLGIALTMQYVITENEIIGKYLWFTDQVSIHSITEVALIGGRFSKKSGRLELRSCSQTLLTIGVKNEEQFIEALKQIKPDVFVNDQRNT